MSTVLLQAAKTGAQSALRIGSQIALQTAQSAISHAFDNREYEGPRLNSFRLMSSTDGAPLPRAYGRVRLGGQVIWASNILETARQEKVGKGSGPVRTDYSYTISFAVALCEGQIAGVERLWANSELLVSSDYTYRVYTGSFEQNPDPLMSAIDGDVPAYRGLAYIVFEDFPLDDYGARLPQINAEVLRPVPRQSDGLRLEDLVTGINLLPSSGEFAYSPTIVEELGQPGAARPINMNNASGLADVEQAINQLEDQLPNCRSVSIITSWFGTDLRAGECRIFPGVESHTRIVSGDDWFVSGTDRGNAYRVSQDGEDRPIYGGTPSDASLIALIRRLRERGFNVNLYPFILMDIPPGNGLPDPYGGNEQAAFPWRGRIMANTAQEVEDFFGEVSPADIVNEGDVIGYEGNDEHRYRRFILHHAKLAQIAGGVDRFVIGSEMVALTTSLPDAAYPAVSKLVELAADVRSILPSARITYAADWTEYRGHQQGAKLTYHLDPLWASPDLDLVAIDAYFPLADWRQNEAHLDSDQALSEHDMAYLSSNVEGGEGYDWFYASETDRASQTRSPITQAHYRYKDVRHWWDSTHINRDENGIPIGGPTDWQPQMKPIWFSEIGCPAVNLGANQPNVFVDPKSVESTLPYFSSGQRDDLIQRNYLRAFLSHYRQDPMVDAQHVWCWDARPYPDFPARRSVWADGSNWQLGHWLTGRIGRLALSDVIADICEGLSVPVDVRGVSGFVEGYLLDRPMSRRQALENLCAAYGVDMFEAPDHLIFRSRPFHTSRALSLTEMADAPLVITHRDAAGAPRDVQLHFLDSGRDQQPAMASGARDIGTHNAQSVYLPAVLDPGLAQGLADRMLGDLRAETATLEMSIAPHVDVSPGTLITVPESDQPYLVTGLERFAGKATRVDAVSFGEAVDLPLGGDLPQDPGPAPHVPAPALFAFDFPGYDGLGIGVRMQPFSPVTVSLGADIQRLDAPVIMGALASDLPKSRTDVIDRHSVIEMVGMEAALDSVSEAEWLAGANRFAVETEQGWEIMAVRDLVLIGPHTYRASHLLRGLEGSVCDGAPSGAHVVWLGQGIATLNVDEADIGETLNISARVARRDSHLGHVYVGADRRPYAPAHLSARREGGLLNVAFLPRGTSTLHWSGPDQASGQSYLVELWADSIPVGQQIIHETSVQIEDVASATDIGVRAIGANYGPGPAAIAAIN